MPSPRYTVRLPELLHTLVQEHILTTRTPFAVLVRDALSAYLADTTPTGMLTPVPTPADSADVVRELQMQLAALTTRVEIIEQRQPLAPIRADSAGTRNEMQALTARVEVLELALTTVPTPRPQGTNTGVDSSADTPPTPVGRGADRTLTAADRGADTAPTGR
jgi:hypothetical protein